MQATEFLESLIVERQKRDAEWVELKWNSVTKQMWEEFQLSKADIEELKDLLAIDHQPVATVASYKTVAT